MGFGKRIYTYWSREHLSSWKSLRKTAYIILPLLIYFLVHDAAEVLSWAGLNQLLISGREETVLFLNAYRYTVQGIINGIAILCGVAAVWQAVRNEISARGKGEKGTAAYIVLAVLAFCSALGLNMLFSILGITESSQAFENTANAQFGVTFWIGILLYGILSPAAEEAIFRGLIYNRMKRCFNYPIALIVSSLLFGCYHGNMVQAVYGTLLGLLIAYVYEKYSSFAAPVLFHGVANVSIYAITYNNRFDGVEKGISIGVIAVSFVGAGICLWKIFSEKSEIK